MPRVQACADSLVARVIQAELSQDFITKGILSDWFSRDDEVAPQVPLRKKPNPRNLANAAKAEELERELERYVSRQLALGVRRMLTISRLKKERSEWDELISSAAQASTTPDVDAAGNLSPLHPELLDSPQRKIVEQLEASTVISTDPDALQKRIRDISEDLEFTVDQFAHGVHALGATKDTAERLADRTLSDAAVVLEERDKERKVAGKGVDAMDALRGLARVLNSGKR